MAYRHLFRPVRRLAAIAGIVMLHAAVTRTAAAQLYDVWHRPVDVRYRHLETTHFPVYFQSGLLEEARTLVGILDENVPEVRARVGLRRTLHVPLVLNRFTDRANGFVTPLPFRQEVEAVPIRGHSLSPRFDGWFETVGPHELVHAAHAESGRGFGVGWMLRRIGPDLARALNLSAPRGINEGMAVWMESRVRPLAGRLNHSLFRMQFRAAMESDDAWSLTQMLEPPSYTRPFDRYYIGGAFLFEHLAANGDVSFFRRARDFYYRFPLLGFGPALWYGTGKLPWALGREMRRAYRAEGGISDGVTGESALHLIASETGTVHRRPVWLKDRTLLTYAHGYHLRPGFYTVDAITGVKSLVAVTSITEDYLYELDAERTTDAAAVLFSHYQADTFEPIRSIADVYRLDLSSGRIDEWTHDARLFAPATAPGGGIWALRNVGPTNEWVHLQGGDQEPGAVVSPESVAAFEDARIHMIAAAPAGDDVAVLANVSGVQAVYRAGGMAAGKVTLRPWIRAKDGSIYDIRWSDDGRYLFFSADPGGISNVYVWVRDRNAAYRLTDVRYGALEPDLSPDGRTLAFVNYRHERYELATAPFDLESARRADPAAIAVDPAGDIIVRRPPRVDASAATELEDTDPYSPILHLRPRVAYPFLLHQRSTGDEDDVALGFGSGIGMEWADPLQYWTAQTHVFYQRESIWGHARVGSGRYLLRPSAEIFRKPSTVFVRMRTAEGVDTVRVGRDERGIGLTTRLPAMFDSNVYQTTATLMLGAEYRSERLFGTEGETLRAPQRRAALNPAASIGYRMQSNPRDIIPGSGARLDLHSTIDVWSEKNAPVRWLRADGAVHLPVFRPTSTGVKLFGQLLAQNRGAQLDLSTFFPRGYETETAFLRAGSYAKGGVELVQPLWYVDDGLLLLPIYVKALYLYGFAETMGGLDGDVRPRSVGGAGLGLQLRLFHVAEVDIRVAPVYRFATRDWDVTYR